MHVICEKHIGVRTTMFLSILCIMSIVFPLMAPTPSYAEGGSISIKSSSDAYTIVFHAFRIADPYGNSLLPAATEEDISERPEFSGQKGSALMSSVLARASEDDEFASEFARILETADSSLPRAEIKSDIDPVLVEDGWYALSGTRLYSDGRTQSTPLIVMEVRGEPVSMAEKPLDNLPQDDSNEHDNSNTNSNTNRNNNNGDNSNGHERLSDDDNRNGGNDNSHQTLDKRIGATIAKLGDNITWILATMLAVSALSLFVAWIAKRKQDE